MTVATTETLECVFELLKQHEAALATVEHSRHPIERDVFGELLTETRALSGELTSLLQDQGLNVEAIQISKTDWHVTPHRLMGQREKVRAAYDDAMRAYAGDMAVKPHLETQSEHLSSGADDKLEVLCSAILSDQ